MSSLARQAGYDPALMTLLPAHQRTEISMVGGAWCWIALGLSAPVAYALLLLTHSAPLSLAVAAAVLLLVLQLVRLTVAGGGIPLDSSGPHRPGSAPLFWLGLLGLMFAQPAQLPLWQQAPLVAQERTSLLAVHQRATAQASDDYARELADCEFVALRLQAIWRQPTQAARNTLAYLALLLGPILFARAQARAALQAYEELKARQARRLVAHDAETTKRTLSRLLAPYTGRA